MSKLKKIQEAEDLCSTENHENINKALQIYKKLSMSELDPFDKKDVIISLYKFIPDEGREMLIRWRDITPFIGGKDLLSHKKLLLLICQAQEIDIHERSITSVDLYNRGFLDICYQAFESIAFEEDCPIQYRVDACRFLFGSETEDNKEIAQESLLEIIANQQIPSKDRYAIIAGFISKTGLSTYLNRTKIKVPYDENFVYALQMAFFECKENGVRERILSGQHILSMEELPTEKEKEEVGNVLLSIASSEDNNENIRADAADVMLRLGNKEQIARAREIITLLGYSGLGKKEGMLDRVQTIYNNSQNMHDEKIADSVERFIERMVENTDKKKLTSYEKIQTDVVQLLGTKNIDAQQKHNAKAALYRVSVDTATFTKYKVSISDIFSIVWTIIQTQPDKDTKKTLEDRMIEELVEMGDTCSSGHSGRFVNVLSFIDPSISISFETQIIANIAGRVNARVRDIPDANQKASISSGMMPDADEEDKLIYAEFIDNALSQIKKELYDEFVTEKYISPSDFENYFDTGSKQWLEYKK
ncbi:MAG TPA: hypothetical protein PKD85_01465 [Saprospiraceae bacterium]|nr:hypothetical protein [Saprospiraceae bacterium]